MSHGQALVERGFSINSNLVVENMHEDNLIAQRIVQIMVQAFENNFLKHSIEYFSFRAKDDIV